jgi:hypothetical protein
MDVEMSCTSPRMGIAAADDRAGMEVEVFRAKASTAKAFLCIGQPRRYHKTAPPLAEGCVSG